MSDLHVVATIVAKAGSEDEVRSALSSLAAASREEAGCISYDLFESAGAPGTFVTVEIWTDQQARCRRTRRRRTSLPLPVVQAALAGAPQIHTLTPVA